MRKVLIAGATGYLGKYLVQSFKQQGYFVRVFVRNEKKLSKVGPFLEPAVREYVDEVWEGDVTNSETIKGCCEGMDIVCSAIGLTRQKGSVSFHVVDYKGNLNLLREAQASEAINKFMYIHVCGAEKMTNPVVEAKNNFAFNLKKSNMNYVIVKPTGYYSDMIPILNMAKKGTMYEIKKGKYKMNPIHGEDLANFCVNVALHKNYEECDVGGPTIYRHRDIEQLAFQIAEKKEHYHTIPISLLNGLLPLVKPFSSKNYALGAFFMDIMTMDVVAPQYGEKDLTHYLRTVNENQEMNT